MPDVRVVDVTEYVDRSNPALSVPKVLVTYLAPDGRPGTLVLDKSRAARPEVEAAVVRDASTRLRVAGPITVRWADHLLPPPPRPP